MKSVLVLAGILIMAVQVHATNLLGVNLGMDRSTANFGFTMDSGESTGSVGGHLFVQTEKAGAGVGQVTSFAGHVRLAIHNQNRYALAIYPGFGMHMVKGLGLGVDDKNVFGPTLRWRLTYDMGNNMQVGLDRLEFWNWFDDTTMGAAAYTSAVLLFNF